jgi:hypothetical protein
MRLFHLVRDVDVSGVSGEGIVAEGVELSDGTAVMRWFGELTCTAVYKNIDSLLQIHGHEGSTNVEWI